jgi:hypothetical protein
MITVSITVNGDSWLNQAQVEQQLKHIPNNQWVCFDTGAEGISLKHSGILDFINQWVDHFGHPQERIVINNPNNYEITPYKNLYQSATNHFFAMSKSYQMSVPLIDANAKKFGFFIGRHTKQRDEMATDVVNTYQSHFIISIMQSRFLKNPWSTWLQTIPSIDTMAVNDQYTGKTDTNLSLLTHYHCFQIELVAETMCAGETFFPTEKTIRPMLGGRPFLIFGPVNFLHNLQQLGFKTYSQCWDERYDRLQGANRWQAIKTVIDYIVDHGYNLETAQQIAAHNQQHLKKWHT